MKKLLFIIILLLFSTAIYAQEKTYKEYSYSQLFEMIKQETDSVFYLENAIIKPSKDEKKRFETSSILTEPKKDIYDSIHVRKRLKLENVNFTLSGESDYQAFGLSFLVFHEKVELRNTNVVITASNFKEGLEVYNDKNSKNEQLEKDLAKLTFISFSKLDNGVKYWSFTANREWYFGLITSEIRNKNESRIHSEFNYDNKEDFSLLKNKFFGRGKLSIFAREGDNIDIQKNIFELDYVKITLGVKAPIKQINFNKNIFSGKILLAVSDINNQHIIDWPQFTNSLISNEAYQFYTFVILSNLDKTGTGIPIEEYRKNSQKSIEHYINIARIENDETFRTEMKLRGRLYKLYKEQYASDFANAAYIEMKDLETARLALLYNQNATFKTYFTWKTNQFLKVFSAYGTEPARAIIFSMYVILAFALIYLFFPNSWDTHGKKRIMDRYAFFFKYMNKKAGIHEVYLEDKKEDILEFDDFKTVVEKQGKTVPKFFTATALPLYKWAVSGTKFSASILRRFDIMRGTWNEVPKKKRIWKSFLLIGAFIIAICYDILIKMLNALMLSINTFTTLGFGEIPIKGLPRYLAIIQGFIGWFMLTIFSVSLISQLLN